MGLSKARIAFETASSGAVATRMTIDGVNVGIGNTNPDKLFVVQGADAEIAINDTNGTPQLRFRKRSNLRFNWGRYGFIV